MSWFDSVRSLLLTRESAGALNRITVQASRLRLSQDKIGAKLDLGSGEVHGGALDEACRCKERYDDGWREHIERLDEKQKVRVNRFLKGVK